MISKINSICLAANDNYVYNVIYPPPRVRKTIREWWQKNLVIYKTNWEKSNALFGISTIKETKYTVKNIPISRRTSSCTWATLEVQVHSTSKSVSSEFTKRYMSPQNMAPHISRHTFFLSCNLPLDVTYLVRRSIDFRRNGCCAKIH